MSRRGSSSKDKEWKSEHFQNTIYLPIFYYLAWNEPGLHLCANGSLF